MMQDEELKSSIKKFYALMETSPDTPDSAFDFIVFLRSFVRTRSCSILPTTELMTVLKVNKPAVFFSLRQMSEQNEIIRFLVGLSTDFEAAEQKLKGLLKDEPC
ncbi:hypothetical protein ACP2W0_17570 [Pseudobacillus badius]|uniref:hypothetical protein n=1 Tax=Bacillus badius TaxID=1455 RepID=UPI0007B039D5|nr:hypothetical protein [Bacillus badius]KZN99112.1 hypothetical protein A4244_08460 [Bacillus badius]MED0665062.1 hypothetical protein [Bacillus badius]OCS84050.1 hypothetical protein A6M11_08475 [Bacillus badius]OVE52655.1 hypothetical protein B1A98_03350 [Bacillus badius]UAT29108.1 hypothetical protein K7T73_10785 [Bacillus badius]